MGKYNDLVSMYHKIFGGEQSDIEKKIEQNVILGTKAPLANSIIEMLRPRSSVMEELRDLQSGFRAALERELEMPIMTSERKAAIETALKSPTMDLRFISDLTERRRLNEQWQDIAFRGVTENFGLPSLSIPSGNTAVSTAFFNLPEIDHPLAHIFSGRAVSITHRKTGSQALSISSTNIPTAEYLEGIMGQRSPMQVIQDAVTSGTGLRFMTSDIETSGVGPFDLPRSIFGQVYDMPASNTVQQALSGISASTTPSDTFDFHMLLPEMQTLTVGRRGGTAGIKLGSHLAEVESKGAILAGRPPSTIYDLATVSGRTDAANEMMRYFERLTDDNTILVGNNFVNFDIPKLIMAASTLPEFMNNPQAKAVLEKVQQKAASGQVIDVTDMARKYLSGKVTERITSAVTAGTPVEQIVDKSVMSLISPETLIKAGLEGEGVKPFGLENLISSTNLLELMSQSGDQRAVKIIEDLAAGAHISSIDASLSMETLKSMLNDQLDILDSSQRSTDPHFGPIIQAARQAVLRSSATVPTSNIANIGEVSDQVFNFLTDKSGVADRTLMGARVQTINPTTGQVEGFIHYNPEIGGYEKVFTDPSKAPMPMWKGHARAEIRRAFSEQKQGQNGETIYGPRVISTGINVSQASQMETTLSAISRFSNLSTIAKGPGQFLSTEAEEDMFVQSMAATRKYIGFPHLRRRPESVTSGPRSLVNMMLGRFEIPSDLAKASAQDLIYQGGAGIAVIDPVLRSNFVAMATLTSEIPYTPGKTEMAKKIAREAEKQRARIEGRTITDTELDAYVEALSSDQLQSIAMRSSEASKYLSEQTVIHFERIASTRVFSGGQVVKPLISKSVLSKMTVEETVGFRKKMVPIVESQFWKKAGLDIATMSTVKRGGTSIVNLIAGKGGMSRENATIFAKSFLGTMQESLAGGNLTSEQAIEQGLVSSVEEFSKYITMFSSSGAIATQQLEEYEKNLIDRLMESGPAYAQVEGGAAEGLGSILEMMGADIGNDLPAVQKGMVFQVQNIGEETVSVSATLPNAAMDQLSHQGGAVSSAIHAEVSGGLMDEHIQALGRAESNPTFRNKLMGIFGREGVDSGFFGSRIGRNRIARDEQILEKFRKVKPKIAMGTIAVAAASAGYYLARKNRKNEIYDEVMHQQPYENPGLVQDANTEIQQDNQQTSTRRDPLVTAGIVGNLDRNKIGHTSMSPNKYDSLFGR